MVVVSCFEFVFCHTNVVLCVTRSCCDSCFVDNVLGKARTVKRAKVFVSAVAFLLVGCLVVFIKDLLIMAFDFISHVCSAAVADLETPSNTEQSLCRPLVFNQSATNTQSFPVNSLMFVSVVSAMIYQPTWYQRNP